jgi:iron complex transport system permease protein
MRNRRFFIPALVLMLIIVMMSAIAFGAVDIPFSQMVSAVAHFFEGRQPANIYEGVFLQLRLPRVLLCAITGAILASSGVLMQGLFRNPIVEPGIAGTSAGAAFGASVVFVLAAQLPPDAKAWAGPLLVPFFAFAGGLLATYAVYVLSRSTGRVSISSLLLTGIAINSIGLSGTGFMSYIARDPQARSITFWNLGTFSGASWVQVLITGTVCLLVFPFGFRYSKQLNAMLLGEEQAGYLGVDTVRLKRRIMLLNTAMVSIATAFVGVISFLGLIIPHILRLILGSDNRKLLPASILSGGILLNLADMAARLLLSPAEIPIGILTSLVGAPVFILLLKKYKLVNTGGVND